ncbi:MAG: arylsulfotransferase family protein [Candidatus Brocadiia bacterium]
MLEDGMLLTGGERMRLHTGSYGVRTYVPEKCQPGYTLFSPAWGYTEFLVDLRGLVVHRWPVTHSNYAVLLADGNLLTHNVPDWIEELRPDGSAVWRWQGAEHLEVTNHHDFHRVSEEQVVCLSRVEEPVRDGVFPPGAAPECMKTDVVVRFNPKTGDILWEFSLGEHVEELCGLAGLPMPIPYRRGKDGSFQPYGPADWAHTNTVEVLPSTPLGERDERFRAGNILVSCRALDIIAVIDPDAERIVWAWGPGILDGQHQPTMLENGNILLFDNGTHRGYSVVRELVPDKGEIVWEYSDGTNFFSPFRSGNQRLPNGNTLICECDAGHIFEVTPEKEIVWDYWSPFVAQGRQHLGKRIHRATRYTPEQVEPLLASRGDEIVGEVDAEGKPVKVSVYRPAAGG